MKRESGHLDAETLGAYIDGELHGPARQAAADHLRVCSTCRETASALGAPGSAARQVQAPEWNVEALVARVEAGISALEA
ncbi:MAG TPA: hypothetical protein DDZ84_03305, partial [Firmicutes bacterium]|nr:hypothetical protein [Bacillota bacterium]